MNQTTFVPKAELQAKIPNGTHMVSADVVRALRGVPAQTVLEMAEAGKFRFVWDVSAGRGNKIPELRFWVQELIQPIPASLTLTDVIKAILGERREVWHGPDVGQMLLVSRPCVHRLIKSRALAGKISKHSLLIQRESLERFLKARSLWNRG